MHEHDPDADNPTALLNYLVARRRLNTLRDCSFHDKWQTASPNRLHDEMDMRLYDLIICLISGQKMT